MSVHRIRRENGATAFVTRWREGSANRQRTFDRRRDADLWDAEVRRRRQLGSLHTLDAGTETLHEYVTETWGPAHLPTLAQSTRVNYARFYDHHLDPYLGSYALRDVTPGVIARWQADRLSTGAGPVAVRRSLTLLGSILQRAVEDELIVRNPARLVRKAPCPRAAEVRPLAPATVEAMRAYLLADGSEHPRRDAALVSVLAYAGLRPGEALALRWGDVRENTLLVQRSVSYGEEKATKTNASRAVRLLEPLRRDLAEWRLASGRPGDNALVFPSASGKTWSQASYQSWRRRAFARALTAAEVAKVRPYDLRHSYASLLLHEGRNVIYVARQLGHDARLTLTVYGHVVEELDGTPQLDAAAAITAARADHVRVSFASEGAAAI
jgi:integrase